MNNVLSAAHEGMKKGVSELKEKYGKKTKPLPTSTGATIKAAIDSGFIPYLQTGKKVVRMYLCHACKGRSMIKVYNTDSRWNACKCGYRHKF